MSQRNRHASETFVGALLLTLAAGTPGAQMLARTPSSMAYVLPPYADPGRFHETAEVVGPLKLGATLTMPAGAGPFPAVVLVQGSGPSDRDETHGPNKTPASRC